MLLSQHIVYGFMLDINLNIKICISSRTIDNRTIVQEPNQPIFGLRISIMASAEIVKIVRSSLNQRRK